MYVDALTRRVARITRNEEFSIPQFFVPLFVIACAPPLGLL